MKSSPSLLVVVTFVWRQYCTAQTHEPADDWKPAASNQPGRQYPQANSRVAQPKLSLCGSSRVSLKKGKSTQVAVEVPVQRLRYRDAAAKRYVVEPGEHEFLIGAASDDLRLKLPLTITAL